MGAFLADSAYSKAFSNEPGPDAIRLISLQFEGPVFDRAPASTGGSEPFAQRFDGGVVHFGGKSIDDDDDFPSPVGGFSPQDDAAFFCRGAEGRLWRGLGSSGRLDEPRDFEARECRKKSATGRGLGLYFLLIGARHGGISRELEFFATQYGAAEVALAGRDFEGVVDDVAGFDANQVGPLVVAQVGHLLGSLAHGGPNHCGGGIGFFDEESPVFDGVGDDTTLRGVHVELRGLGCGEADGGVALVFDPHIVVFVIIGRAFEPVNFGLPHIAHLEVGVERFLALEGCRAPVFDLHFQGQRRADGDAVTQGPLVGFAPDGFGLRVGLDPQGERDGAVGVLRERFGRPRAGPHKTMLGSTVSRAEPGEDDGDAAANGLSGFKPARLAQEK